MLSPSDKYYPACLHYAPKYKATLWVLILLADLEADRDDPRTVRPLKIIKEHFYDSAAHIYSLKDDHFPIPCLNGNIIYLDAYFNKGAVSRESLAAARFFSRHQRFDDGEYTVPASEYCSNKSCYGKHSCYWGIVKLFKGLSFIPESVRTDSMKDLLGNCVQYILLHNVCYRSHDKNRIMINKIDRLTFPNMYQSDFLEILWLLSREKIKSEKIYPALALLKSKRKTDGNWNLERKINNLITSIGKVNQPNQIISRRAAQVLDYYDSQDVLFSRHFSKIT